eukprot:3465395-Amphidinium_carterae.1
MSASGAANGTPWADIWPRPTSSVGGGAAGRPGITNPWATSLPPSGGGGTTSGDHDHGHRSPLDVPPGWDGSSPETQLPAYLKSLEVWKLTTKTIARQRGVAVLSQASGDLRALIATMDLNDLTSDDAVDHIQKLLQREYSWTLHRALPMRFEQALFSPSGQRQKNESFLGYTARKGTALRELAMAGLDLPEAARGLIYMRDAALSRQEL